MFNSLEITLLGELRSFTTRNGRANSRLYATPVLVASKYRLPVVCDILYFKCFMTPNYLNIEISATIVNTESSPSYCLLTFIFLRMSWISIHSNESICLVCFGFRNRNMIYDMNWLIQHNLYCFTVYKTNVSCLLIQHRLLQLFLKGDLFPLEALYNYCMYTCCLKFVEADPVAVRQFKI